MNQQDAIDRGLRQRQRKLIDQRRQRRPSGRPFQHALCSRHEGQAALAILAEQAEIGRRVADAEHTLAFGVRPSFANAAIDELSRHGAEAPRIEIAQVDDVHVANLTRRYAMRRAEYCIAPEALTPYFSRGLRCKDDGDIMAAEIRLFTCLTDN